MTNVKELNNKELISKLQSLVAEEKKNVAAQIVILKEVRQRKLALEMGYPNLLEFCAVELGLTRDQAWKRSQAAGVVEREPVFLDLLKKGETSVSTLAVMAPKLSDKTSVSLREFVPGKSKREVEAFVSNLNRDGSRSEGKQTVRISMDLEPEVVAKLERARKILKANRSELSYEDILSEALELLLDKKDPERKAARANARRQKTAPVQVKLKGVQGSKIEQRATHSISGPAVNKRTRYIPAAVRHQVYKKADGRCCYTSPGGLRCAETAGLAVDHIQMYCKGGEHSSENLRLMCPTHNRLLAEKELGFSCAEVY
jgi:hypothetical protein